MAISSPGLGSGLNINSIVSQLVAVESQPVKLLQNKSTTLQTKMSVFGQIKSELAALKDAASALNSATTWSSKSLTSSNTAAVTGTATTDALASTFSITVNKLAKGHSVYSGPVTAGFTVAAAGNFTITSDNGTSQTVTLLGGETLDSFAAKINATTTANGVSVSVVTNSAGTKQLMFRSSSIGVKAAFQITTDIASLDPFKYAGGLSGPGDMTRSSEAMDANATIDGIDVSSETNTLANAVPGVTLNLLQESTTAGHQIAVAVDKDAIKAKIQAFQDAYNKLYADLKTQTAYNASTKTGGPLLGDNTATGLQNMLRNLVGTVVPSTASSISRLSNLGLEIQSDGSLKTNSTKLDAALQNPSNVKAFFSSSTGDATEHGVTKRIYDFAFGALAVGGSVSTHSTAFQKSIDQNTATISKLNLHIAAYQKQLLAQYTALDKNMAQLNSLSTFVSQQVAQWNKTG